MAHDKAVIVTAALTIMLLTTHLAQDVVYGIEAGDISDFIAVLIASVWLYATIAFAERRTGCVLLLIGAFLTPVVPLSHVAGDGVGEDVRTFDGAFFFVWTLLALGVTATVSFLLSIQGLWRLKQSVLSFILWAAVPVAAGSALLGYVVYALFFAGAPA